MRATPPDFLGRRNVFVEKTDVDPELERVAYMMRLAEFIEACARGHTEFREVCKTVAHVYRLTYDHAVIVVRHRWPQPGTTISSPPTPSMPHATRTRKTKARQSEIDLGAGEGFTLTVESAVDGDRIMAERQQSEAARAASDALQTDLFGAPVSVPGNQKPAAYFLRATTLPETEDHD